jgi:hypothetical protein
MTVSVFLSHNYQDKPFVRKLAQDLEAHGVKYWLDEAEMKIGDSLIKKIRDGIDNVNYFAVILSPNSVDAPWVENELDVAMNLQISGKPIKVLPILLEKCELPGFLVGKLYADFQAEENYQSSLKVLLNSIGIVFNKNVLNLELPSHNLGTATDSAFAKAIPLLSKPFHRPFQYIGLSIQKAEEAVGVSSNEVGNIIADNDHCHMLLEAEGNFIGYVSADIKATEPHYLNQEFDSEPMLGAFSISVSELEIAEKQTHCHTYYDHKRRLKVSVSCADDGGPISVAFSSKYYGM